MRLAHIAPISVLGFLPEQQSAHFCISRVVIQDSVYAKFYREQMRRGKHVILDNPVHENEPINFSEFFTAAEYLQPTVAILPDVIDDHAATMANAKQLSEELRERCPGTQILAVPHAEEHDVFVENAAELLGLRGVSFLGLTLERRLNNDQLAYARRAYRLKRLLDDPRFSDVHIHYLGVSELGWEFVTSEARVVYSADTSKFAARCLLGQPAAPPAPVRTPYPGRIALGGSSEYFAYQPDAETFNYAGFTGNLTRWSAYAEGKQ
jgi:hypothetical protein